jgi:hypothetical protein
MKFHQQGLETFLILLLRLLLEFSIIYQEWIYTGESNLPKLTKIEEYVVMHYW